MLCEDLSEGEDYEEDLKLHVKPSDRQYADIVCASLWPHLWLDEEAIFAFRYYFMKVSVAFDNKFFKAGKRYTTKCARYNNAGSKNARHNLVSVPIHK
jgi:hypothetical protein